MITPHGLVTTIAGNGHAGFQNGNSSTAQFSHPSGICVWRGDWQSYEDTLNMSSSINHGSASKGTLVLFVADTGNHQIRKITINVMDDVASLKRVITHLKVECFSGCVREELHDSIQPRPGLSDGSKEEAKFDSPRGITVSESGNVYVVDTNNHLVRKIDKFGWTSTVSGTTETVNRNSNECKVETCKDSYIVGIQGFQDGETLNSRFSYPTDLVVTSNEELIFVIDGHRLRQIDLLQKTVTTIAGSNSQIGRDGFGLQASFSSPQGITMTSDGYIYISDAASCRIRRASYYKDNLPHASCNDTLSTLFRPSGCTSYDDAVDDSNMKVSPLSYNVYYNYEYRNITSPNYGEDFIGRRIKECIGSPPPLVLSSNHDKQQGANKESLRRINEMLVVMDDSSKIIQEHPNEGTLMTVYCPVNCENNILPKDIVNILYKDKPTIAYSENISICSAATHSGLLQHNADDGLIDVIITSINGKTDFISEIDKNRTDIGQFFCIEATFFRASCADYCRCTIKTY
jgi:NHL repeat.